MLLASKVLCSRKTQHLSARCERCKLGHEEWVPAAWYQSPAAELREAVPFRVVQHNMMSRLRPAIVADHKMRWRMSYQPVHCRPFSFISKRQSGNYICFGTLQMHW
eukprot:SAG31_NODE_3338_length_4388_cov_1.970856_2_plen_106_part_00